MKEYLVVFALFFTTHSAEHCIERGESHFHFICQFEMHFASLMGRIRFLARLIEFRIANLIGNSLPRLNRAGYAVAG